MSNLSGRVIAFYAGLLSVLIGGVAFVLNWYVWGGGMPGYGIFLFPGNLVLAIFSEEINFWPKFLLLLGGQFTLIALLSMLISRGIEFVKQRQSF
ncbi:hypothetical protein [Neptunicella sp. SCSIO 80796]|uniref:hypothetical protein n=1 Tax=Neptunicella plasticusilytica TaxID=3117012 RepID=UPI003A4D9586